MPPNLRYGNMLVTGGRPPEGGLKVREVHIFCDGACSGNPGPAAIGVLILDFATGAIHELSESIGEATNNIAEYTALIRGLEWARKAGATAVEVYTDSELVARHISGEYKVRNEGLQPLYAQALALLRSLGKARVTHVPRTANRRADFLATRAL